MSNHDSIIFDLDGTLFQTDKLALPAFYKTFDDLGREGYNINFTTDKQLLSVIGMTLPDIWKRLLPEFPTDVHVKANKYMLQNEIEGVNEGYGALYPQVPETLMELKERGFKLFIASNGLEEYIKKITEAFRIQHLFEGLYSAGEYSTTSKVDLVKLIVKNHSIINGIMVGDRKSDIEAGIENKLFVVGCHFGFSSENELEGANIVITNFKKLLEIV